MIIQSAHQRTPLILAPRTVLVTVDVLRAKFGCDAQRVFELVEDGRLRWVFNVGIKRRVRELRFWLGEIIAPQHAPRKTADEVISAILGSAPAFRRGEFERAWVLSAQHVMRLVDAGELRLTRSGKVTRISAKKFLERRLRR